MGCGECAEICKALALNAAPDDFEEEEEDVAEAPAAEPPGSCAAGSLEKELAACAAENARLRAALAKAKAALSDV